MRQITVQQALREVSLIEDKVQKTLRGAVFIGAADKVNLSTVERNVNKGKAKFQQAVDLINNYHALKAAIATSNAQTYVTIGGVQFTVAAAIEKKKSIDNLEKPLLQTLKSQLAQMQSNLIRHNEKVQAEADKVASVMYANTEDKSAYSEMVEKFVKDRSLSVIDPLDLEARVEALETFIETFENEVDYKLTESNVLTTIEVS